MWISSRVETERSVNWSLVIFDCDGVLVDSEPTSNRVMRKMLTEIGLPMSIEQTEREFVGRAMEACLRIIERRLGRPAPPDFEERYDSRVFAAFRTELRPVPGVREVLKRIQHPYCVASSGSHAKMRMTLGLTELLPSFEGRMFSATEVTRGKPHPDLFLYAAKSLGAAPEGCAVVEDTPRGVLAGVAAGMTVFGYAGRTPQRELASAGARCFEDMEELPELLVTTIPRPVT